MQRIYNFYFWAHVFLESAIQNRFRKDKLKSSSKKSNKIFSAIKNFKTRRNNLLKFKFFSY